jgi:hypothetical protein
VDTDLLYYGDCLEILRKYIPDESVDLVCAIFGCSFDDLFEVVLIDPETKKEQVLEPRH